MESVDKVIEVLCEDIRRNYNNMVVEELCDLTKALSDLVVAKSQLKQSEVDMDMITRQVQGYVLKQLEASKYGGTRVKEDVSNNKRTNRSTDVEIKVESKELDEAIEKANQLTELLREAQKIVDSLSNKRCASDIDRISEAFVLASKRIMESESLV